MARKDFEEYYSKIKEQYFRMVNMLGEVDKSSGEKLIDPQTVQNLQIILEPVKNSYLSLAYIEYLLNLPKNKKVRVRNKRQFDSLLSKIDKSSTSQEVLKSNDLLINEASKLIEEEIV